MLIERRTARMVEQERQVIDLLLGSRLDAGASGHAFPGDSEDGSSTTRPSVADLERFAPQWERVIPDAPALRASVAHLLAQTYRFTAGDIPNIRRALRLDDGTLRQAYEAMYRRPLVAIYAAEGEEGSLSAQADHAAQPVRSDILRQLSWVYLRKGDLLMREGDEGDGMYVVVNGRLRATVRDENGNQQRVGEIGRGETVGEMALLTGERRSTTVDAMRDSEVIRLSKAGFERLVEDHPRVLLPLVRVMAARLWEATRTQRSGTGVTTIALLPVSAGVQRAEIAQLLAAALGRFGETLHLTSSSPLPTGHVVSKLDGQELSAWLNDQESRYRYVLYEADAEATSWTHSCLRQADRLLLLARANDATHGDTGHGWLSAAAGALDRELVLVHADGTGRPSGTRQWLDRWQAARHHHVRLGREEDVGRLARSLVGATLGLVLSGGGARCFAQIGAIRALQEAEIPIDWVAGSSAGAIIAGEVAQGWDWETILARSRQLLTRRGVLDYTFPIVSLLAARRLARFLGSLFGETQIEDLWLGFFCTSSNLASARLTIHRAGSLRRAVRASCALPGVLPPLLEHGELLVDGGILDNMPVDAMKELCDGGPVIAVDVSAEFQLPKEYHFGEGISAGQLLWNRANPFAKTKLVVPSIVNVLLRTAELQAVRSRKDQRHKADLYIQPPVATFGTFDTKAVDRLVEVGYECARDEIAAWRSAGDAVKVMQSFRDVAGVFRDEGTVSAEG